MTRFVRTQPVKDPARSVSPGREENLVIGPGAGGFDCLEDGVGVIVHPVGDCPEIFNVDHRLPLSLMNHRLQKMRMGGDVKRKIRAI